MQMMNVDSRNSFSTDLNDPSLYDQVTHIPSSRHLRRSSNEEQSQLLVGAGGASHESQFSLPFAQMSSGQFGEKMEKSQSNESTSSSSSKSSSRNAQRLQDLIQVAAKRTLMPKGGSEDNISMSRDNSSQSMTRVESKDASQDKIAISSKPTYQRPKHDRVFCKDCDNHQEGFRGEHELRRHQDREHKKMVKKWQCIDPTAMGPDGQDHPKPVIPLARCKACNHQKKKYGAYYNAAAHLRRSHFKPKAKGRSKNTKTEDAEKRGGKGGGDWPPMSELKYWMKEVEEQAIAMTNAQQAAADLADASDEDILDMDDQAFSQQSSMSTISNDLDFQNFLDPSPTTINSYPAAINNDLFSLPTNMNLDLSGAGGQGQCMDMFGAQNAGFPPMPLDFSDGNAVNDQLFQNNAAAMGFLSASEGVTNAHNRYEEQILNGQGFGFANFSY
jgi:tetrahydromethanopterin S-methyltransferase subunit B